MRKILGTLAIAVLALTACSAPAETPSIQPFVGSAPEVTITAAPIPAQSTADTETMATGGFGDPATDAAFLEGVKDGWAGSTPSDDELVSAAKLACDEFAKGVPYRDMRLVEGVADEDLNNGIRIAVYASRNYCTDFNTDNN